ncbi:MAG: plasmid pRiA4b ORF-3 family protein [Planctomycetota bacterium]|nr:plasmid pRiA4b ORF-3 family protein [Planctomycetota bacterium]
MAERKRMGRVPAAKSRRIYELEVGLLSGFVTEAFVKANPVVARTILIRGDQTLEQLHEAIFKAYNRFDGHMYEFQVGGKRTHDPKARRYVLAGMFSELLDDPEAAGTVSGTTLDDLGLKEGEAFVYWFDFGDDWWHQINVVAIREEAGSGKYPRITAMVGESPPQYPDLDDDEEDDDEET